MPDRKSSESQGPNPSARPERRVIAPLPSLPQESEEQPEAVKPKLRLAGERQMGAGDLGSVVSKPEDPSLRPSFARSRMQAIELPQGHAPRGLLGDAPALFEAARLGREGEVQRLMGCGADPNLTDDPGNEHKEAIAFLCRQEDVGEDNVEGIKFGRTACHMAAARGNDEVVRVLIEAGTDVNRTDHAGVTPLMRSSRGGHLDVMRRLVEAGARVDARDLRDSTALMRAAACGHGEAVRFLLQHGAELEGRDCTERTPLLAAAAEVREEAVRILLEAGADPTARDRGGDDALAAVVSAVEPEDPSKPSPVHVVPEDRILPIVSLLLAAGAQDEPDGSGVLPSVRAEERGLERVAELLRA